MDEEVQERQQVTVGKPLVSKLNLHEPQTPHSASSFFSHNSFNNEEWSSTAETFTSVNSATNTTWSHNAQPGRESSTASSLVPTRSVNIPEETDTPE